MCNYVDFNEGKCRISNQICPYVFYCNKTQTYKELRSMPSNCKIKEQFEIPKGTYKVCFERRGYLYIDVKGNIEIVSNPFDYIPLYVKMSKRKSGEWKVKEV